MLGSEVISRGHVSWVRGRVGCYFLFRNPADVASFREAGSWQFVIRRKKLSIVWTKQNTSVGQMQPTSSLNWPLLDCSLTHWNVSSTKAESLSFWFALSQAQYLGQKKPSINELKPVNLTGSSVPSVNSSHSHFPLWFYVPNNRFLIGNAMHMGPGEY